MSNEFDVPVVKKRTRGTALSDTALHKQVAALASLGQTTDQIAKELKADRATIVRIMELDETKGIIQEIGDAAVSVAKARLKSRIASLADDIVDTLKYQLTKKKSVQAAALGLKVIGLDGGQEVRNQGNIIVQLPGVAKDDTNTITIKKVGEE